MSLGFCLSAPRLPLPRVRCELEALSMLLWTSHHCLGVLLQDLCTERSPHACLGLPLLFTWPQLLTTSRCVLKETLLRSPAQLCRSNFYLSKQNGRRVKLLCRSTTSQKKEKQKGCISAHTVDRCRHPDLAKQFFYWESIRENEILGILKDRISYSAVSCLCSGWHLMLPGLTVD